MSISIVCPSCGLQGDAPDNFQANRVTCPRCAADVPVRDERALADITPLPAALFDSRFHVIDQFFRGLETPLAPPQASHRAAAKTPNGSTAAALAGSPDEARAEEEWEREERTRIDAYVAKQFGLIRQQREETTGWRSQVEATLVSREQNLNRQEKLLAVRTEKARDREAECDRREAELAEPAEARRHREELVEAVETQRQVLAALTEQLVRAEARRRELTEQIAEYERAREAAEAEAGVRRELEHGAREMARQGRELLVDDGIQVRNLRSKIVGLSARLERGRRERTLRAGADLQNMRAKVVFLSRELETLRGKK